MSHHAADAAGHWHEAISRLQQRMLDGVVSGRAAGQLVEALLEDIASAFEGLRLEYLPDGAPRDEADAEAVPVRRPDGTPFARVRLAGRAAAVPRVIRDRLLAVCAHGLEAAARYEARARELTYRAHFDALTGAANRGLLRDRLVEGISRAHRERRSLAILFLDLDNFKTINDHYGHEVGDGVLQRFVRRVGGAVEAPHLLARMGGDEFVVMIEESLAPAGYEAIAERLLRGVNGEYAVGGHGIHVTTSVGVSVYPQDGLDAEQLLRAADAALLAAKGAGRAGARRAAASLAAHRVRYARQAVAGCEPELAN